MMPMPTLRLPVQASAAEAAAMPLLRKQSSQSQSSSRPASSAARATRRRVSGGFCGRKMTPRLVMALIIAAGYDKNPEPAHGAQHGDRHASSAPRSGDDLA